MMNNGEYDEFEHTFWCHFLINTLSYSASNTSSDVHIRQD